MKTLLLALSLFTNLAHADQLCGKLEKRIHFPKCHQFRCPKKILSKRFFLGDSALSFLDARAQDEAAALEGRQVCAQGVHGATDDPTEKLFQVNGIK